MTRNVEATARRRSGVGTPRREFLHVDDDTDACINLRKVHSDDAPVNAGAGDDLPLLASAQIICKTVGFYDEIECDLSRACGTPHILMSRVRIRSLGWTPWSALRGGLADVYACNAENTEQTG
jgi:GDP-L-fucose synthase